MAKKIVAVTDVKHNGDTYPAGSELDPSQFNRDELKQLHDAGAIVVNDDSKPDDVTANTLTPEELGQKGAQMQDVSATAKEGTAATANAPENKTSAEKATPPKK